MSDTAFSLLYAYLLAIALSKDLDSIVNLSPKHMQWIYTDPDGFDSKIYSWDSLLNPCSQTNLRAKTEWY